MLYDVWHTRLQSGPTCGLHIPEDLIDVIGEQAQMLSYL